MSDATDDFALVLFSGGQDSATCLAWALEHSHSCYLGERTHRHPWGYGCGSCPACDLRAAGWARWKR